jgi:cyclopropane fatty-acyl-phospholipid synthase-like methyltransferase
VSGVSAALADVLTRAGLPGRTVLDVGCGVGALAKEFVARGTERASGVGVDKVLCCFRDVGRIDERVRGAGFRLAEAGSRRLIWHLAVYVQPAEPAGEAV